MEKLDKDTIIEVMKYSIWFELIQGNPIKDYFSGSSPEEAADSLIDDIIESKVEYDKYFK